MRVLMFMLVRMGRPDKGMEMGMSVPAQLPNDIEKPEENQHAAGQPRKPDPDPVTQRDPEQSDEQA